MFRERRLLWHWGPIMCWNMDLRRLDGGNAPKFDASDLHSPFWRCFRSALANFGRSCRGLIFRRKVTQSLSLPEPEAGSQPADAVAASSGPRPSLSPLDIIIRRGYKDLLSGDIVIQVRALPARGKRPKPNAYINVNTRFFFHACRYKTLMLDAYSKFFEGVELSALISCADLFSGSP